jgi:hypothetical protein
MFIVLIEVCKFIKILNNTLGFSEMIYAEGVSKALFYCPLPPEGGR